MGIGNYRRNIIGDWGLGPIPNPQSPIPNPQSPIQIIDFLLNAFLIIKKNRLLKLNKKFLYRLIFSQIVYLTMNFF